MTPANKGAVVAMSTNNDSPAQTIYSKLIIRASNKTKVSLIEHRQNQMQFRCGDSAAGDLVGALFAGNEKYSLGGLYKNITNNALRNTLLMAPGTLNEIKSASDNTALGYKALEALESGSRNTAVDFTTGSKIKAQNDNTFYRT